MMKTALCTWLMPLLLLLPVTEADLSSSEELVYPISPVPGMRQEFKATIDWTSSLDTGECWARRLGWPEPYTRFMLGETKTIVALDNKCLQFTCGFSSGIPLLDLNESGSARAHRHGCFRNPPLEKIWNLLDYTCNCFVTSHQYIHYVVKDKGLVHGHLSVVSRFVCQKTDRRSTRALSSDGYGMVARGPPRGTEDLGYEVAPSTRNDKTTVPAGTVTPNGRCQQSRCMSANCEVVTTFRGCVMHGECFDEGDEIFTEKNCNGSKCQLNPETNEYAFVPYYTGCYNFYNSRCYAHNHIYRSDNCFSSICNGTVNGKLTTFYEPAASSENCRPSTRVCTLKYSRPLEKECFYNRQCYPVMSILVIDPCYQFICLKENNKTQWKIRALGCQGPKGCMQFGEQIMDPIKKNIYRCEYQLTGLGFVYSTFYKACVENGTVLAVGESVFIDDVWYSCSRDREGLIKTPVYKKDHRENGTRFCGNNNITGQSMYSNHVYFMKVGTCFFTSSCKKVCNYFDEPCQTREMNPYEMQSIGDKINQAGSECVCTQSQMVSNMLLKNEPTDFTNLYLCGEKGVRGAACKDPEEPGIFRKWGELWSDRQSRLCGCHPLQRKAFCSHNVDEVISPKTNHAK